MKSEAKSTREWQITSTSGHAAVTSHSSFFLHNIHLKLPLSQQRILPRRSRPNNGIVSNNSKVLLAPPHFFPIIATNSCCFKF